MEYQYHYLIDLLNAPVRYEGESTPFGRLCDIGVARKWPYPLTVSLEIRTRKSGRLVLPWTAVAELHPHEVVFRKDSAPPPEADFWLRSDVLGHQVVDISAARLRHVNDVHLLHIQEQLIAGHVEIGILGILRRLHIDRLANRFLNWLFDYKIKDSFVSWRHIEVIAPGPRSSMDPARLATVRPVELAEILEQLGAKERKLLFDVLPVRTAAGVLQAAVPETQKSLVSLEDHAKAADVLEQMPTREAAGLLRDLRDSDAQAIIGQMEAQAAQNVRTLLRQSERTAGALMSPSCVEASPEETAAQVLDRVRSLSGKAEVLYHIFILDFRRHAVGVLSLRELLKADPAATIESLMTTNLVTVRPDTHVREIARLFAKYGFRSIPVVDERGNFLGAVRLKSMLGTLGRHFRG